MLSRIKKCLSSFTSGSNNLNIISSNGLTSVNINGVTYSGSNVCVKNNRVYIDGVIQEQIFDRDINVVVNGNIDKVELDVGDITVNGNVSQGINISTGDVECKDVTGNVSTSCGDIKCGKVTGNVSTTCGDIN